ncbi:DEAD/DEAH box helicase [Methylicorpusculum oleiharenae]|uniref:DEAD/DEAH box helicase n=1 Tax=Methylicorpusculum oleiharenae TaxID=1338687 RepID=UPI00135CA8CE|nr:DEAD/DEAH box helicase [Methylicorpusculum oleiharenae]MCD2451121.1 DEAD/DEAH box helicase [Methylicorpusculum oleiharenae]
MMEFNKLWSFKARHQQAVTEPSHHLTIRFKNDGIYYGVEPELADWPNQWHYFGQDSSSISLLNQIEELGHLVPLENQLFLNWDSLYQLLTDEAGSSNELLKLLKLPEFSDLRPSLASQGSLEDLDFRITLSDWVSPPGNKLQMAPEVTGAVIQYQDHQFLLTEPVWRLVSEVRTFYSLPQECRTPLVNRQKWSLIRRYACSAKVPMVDFLKRTVVLSPEKLLLHLHKSASVGNKTVQVEPHFDGAPPQWLDTFDKYTTVPERYDIPDGQGIIQVLVSPQVRAVLQELRRWPGRYVAGQRAEAFIRNPYAALGDDAVAVIDEAQFEEAREVAGIEFEQFFIDVKNDENGRIIGVGLLIESISSASQQTNRYAFADTKKLESFIKRFERHIQEGFQCIAWEGYELEILGDAEYQLANLKLLLSEWMPAPHISVAYADIFNLGRYSERIEGIGVEKNYVSPFIARKADENGWVPSNVEFGLAFMPENSAIPINIQLSDSDRKSIQETIDQAEQQQLDVISIPGIDKPVSVAEAKQILEVIQTTEEQIRKGEFSTKQQKAPSQSLLLKSNIYAVDYQENRKQALELPSDSQARLPSVLRESVSLKHHQLQGVAWLQHLWRHAPQHCRGALLADDMGLGKTLQILTFIAGCIEEELNIDPVLIVAPVSLLENWQEEIDKFFKPQAMSVLMLYGNQLKDQKLDQSEIDPQLVREGLVKFLVPNWLGNAKVVLTTYETLRDLELSLASQHWSIMVCDEAQKIKNPNALVTRSAKKQNVRLKIACTGTPVENSLADLWCLFDFIQPGFLGALNDFGSRYRRPIEAKTEEETARVNELRALIEPQTLRRTKAQVAKDLPSKIEVESCRSLPLSTYQRELYRQVIQAYHEKQNDNAIKNHLGLIQYLRQLCTSPYPVGAKAAFDEPLSEREIKSPKLKWLLELLADIRERNDKVILFVEFLDLQRQLQLYIAERFKVLPDIINGSTSAASSATNSRQKRIRAFQEKPGFGVIILSPLAVGFGVNIQAANHVIHFTRTWNPAKEDQATDRAYRIGQTKDVYVYYPVITAEFVTFDMKLDRLISWKRGLSDDMLNGCGDLSSSEFSDLGAPEGGTVFIE